VPILTLRAIKEDEVVGISKQLIDELEDLLECPRDYFTLELRNSTFIKDGDICNGYPIVDVSWFDRGQEVQDKAADIITRYIKELGYETVDVSFHILKEKLYYENGSHF
jgi:hypothetical protein